MDIVIIFVGFFIDIFLGEFGDYEYFYKFKNDVVYSNVFLVFFIFGIFIYIGNLIYVKKFICGYSYWIDGIWDGMCNVWK